MLWGLTHERRTIERSQWFVNVHGNILCAKCAHGTTASMSDVSHDDYGRAGCVSCGALESVIVIDASVTTEHVACKVF